MLMPGLDPQDQSVNVCPDTWETLMINVIQVNVLATLIVDQAKLAKIINVLILVPFLVVLELNVK